MKKSKINQAERDLLNKIHFSDMLSMVKEMNRKSIIVDNTDILKPKTERPTYSASGSCTGYDFKPYTYETFIMEVYELQKLKNKLVK